MTPFIKTGCMKGRRWYVGIVRGDYRYPSFRGCYEAFHSPTEPDHKATGWKYAAVIGPFETMRAALWAEKYGRNNPHFQHVRNAERISKTSSEV